MKKEFKKNPNAYLQCYITQEEENYKRISDKSFVDFVGRIEKIICDFLSVSYVNSQSKLDDNNIFGMDIDPQMVSLATLNMLLNGDGNAKIEQRGDLGSILYKFDKENDIIELDPNTNYNGEWDNRADNKELKKFDVVLTNPPFGKGRAFYPRNERER